MPAGTAMLLNTTVAHDFAEALAAEAAVNVQLVARFSIGSATGAARTPVSREVKSTAFPKSAIVEE